MPWDMGDGMGWWMFLGGPLWIAVWGAVIYLIVALVRGSGRSTPEDDPVAILKQGTHAASSAATSTGGWAATSPLETPSLGFRGRPGAPIP